MSELYSMRKDVAGFYKPVEGQRPKNTQNAGTHEDENVLKPCPFCGGKVKRFYGSMEEYGAKRDNRPPSGSYQITCEDCPATMEWVIRDDEWNHRI